MLTDDQLRDYNTFLRFLERAVSEYPPEYQHCVLQGVTACEEPRFCIIRAGMMKEGSDDLLTYPDLRLRRETFDCRELPGRIHQLKQTGKLSSKYGDIAIDLTNSFPQQNFYPSHSEYHEWPGNLYQLGAGQRNYVPPKPLVGLGLPPYFNVLDVVRNWIGLPSAGDSDARNGRLLLFIPTFEARLESLKFSDEVLTVESTARAGGKLWLSVLASDGHNIVRHTQELQPSQQFRLMENPTSLQIFITNESGETVDTFSEEERWASRERVIYAGASFSQDTMNTIRRGETDAVEFKEFIRLEDKKKSADIVKAVISFANAAGGTLFMGVSDDAEVIGVDGNAPNDKQKASTFERDYFAGIRMLLQEKLNRIPSIDYRSERIGDKTIFVLRVHEGGAKPYFNVQTKDCFIRRGASDVRPDPDSELRQMFGAQDGSSLSHLGWNG